MTRRFRVFYRLLLMGTLSFFICDLHATPKPISAKPPAKKMVVQKKPVRLPHVKTRVNRQPDNTLSINFIWPIDAKATVTAEEKHLVFTFDKPGDLNHARFSAQLPRNFKLISITRGQTPLIVRLRSSTFYKASIQSTGKTVTFNLAQDAEKDAAEKARKKAMAEAEETLKVVSIKPKMPEQKTKKPAAKKPAVPVVKKALPVSVHWTTKEEEQVLRFKWNVPVKMAAFWMGNYFWILFDSPAKFQTQALKAALIDDEIRELKFGHSKEISWVRFVPNRHNYPSPSKEGDHWVITFYPQEEPPKEPLALGLKRQKFGAKEALISVQNNAQSYKIEDPIFKQPMLVVPLREPGTTYAEHKQFLQFTLLPAVQGVAIVPLDDTLTVEVDPTQIIIRDQPELLVSNAPHMDDSLNSTFVSLLKFYNWSRLEKPWALLHYDLKDAVYKSRGNGRMKAKIDLARFYLESGLDVEAVNALKSLKERNTFLLKDPSFLALYTVSLIVDRRFDEAQKMLAKPLLAKDPEMRVWRGTLFALKGEWRKAQVDMKFALSFAKTYPPQIQNMILLAAAEVMAMRGHISQTSRYLKAIDKKTLSERQLNYMHYIEGLLQALGENHKKAEIYWQQAFDQGDHFTKAKAGFALIKNNLDRSDAALKNDISKLERLKYFWRGDYIEYEIMQSLSALYFQQGDYRSAVETLRLLKKNLKEKDKIEATNQSLIGLLEKIYLDHFDGIDTIKGLSIYEEQKDLLKLSPKIIGIQNQIIEQYINLNLVRRALTVLHAMRQHLAPEELFQNTIRHVAILLLDHQGQKALSTLVALPSENQEQADQIRHLKAQIYLKIKQTPKALNILEKDFSKEADILRATIYRSEENWEIAGDIFLRLAEKYGGNHPQDYLLNAVICYTLSESPEKMQQLFKRNRTVIKDSKHKDLFALLLDDTQNQMDNQAQYIETLNKFFSQYEENLKNIAKV